MILAIGNNGAIFLPVVGHENEVFSPGDRRDHSPIPFRSGLCVLWVVTLETVLLSLPLLGCNICLYKWD